MDIIQRNFFRLMRSGALNEYDVIEPMSQFKWRRVVKMAVDQDVANVAAKAAKNLQFEEGFNMSASVKNELLQHAENNKVHNLNVELTNQWLNKRLKSIHLAEKRNDQYTKSSLELFDIIIVNCQTMLHQGANMRLIIRMGNYMRINSHSIDYQRVEQWLRDTHMIRVAQLLCSVLITHFGFRQDEIPFVKKVNTKAESIVNDLITNKSKKGHTRGLTYFEYAPIENTSIIIDRLRTRLDKIEE